MIQLQQDKNDALRLMVKETCDKERSLLQPVSIEERKNEWITELKKNSKIKVAD